jgi:hypothetical protein
MGSEVDRVEAKHTLALGLASANGLFALFGLASKGAVTTVLWLILMFSGLAFLHYHSEIKKAQDS